MKNLGLMRIALSALLAVAVLVTAVDPVLDLGRCSISPGESDDAISNAGEGSEAGAVAEFA